MLAGAQRAGVAVVPIVACVPCVLTTDRAEARAAADQELGVALRLPAFRHMLERSGAIGQGQPAELGFTDHLLDEVVAWGDETALVRRLSAYANAGVAEIAVAPIAAGSTAVAASASRAETLAAVARLLRP